MPHSKPRSRMEVPLEAKDIELYHLGRHRPGAGPPNPAGAASRNSSEDAMPRVAVRPALYVTSAPHPFWRTKKGIALSVVVVLAILGGIVGGIVGAEKGNNDSSRRTFGIPPGTTPTSTAGSKAVSSTSASQSAVATETVTEIVSRSVPRRYLQPLVDSSPPAAATITAY